MKLQDLREWGRSGNSNELMPESHGLLSNVRRLHLQREAQDAERTLRALQVVITLLAIAAMGTLWAVYQIVSQR